LRNPSVSLEAIIALLPSFSTASFGQKSFDQLTFGQHSKLDLLNKAACLEKEVNDSFNKKELI
jgi:hypothetical protein